MLVAIWVVVGACRPSVPGKEYYAAWERFPVSSASFWLVFPDLLRVRTEFLTLVVNMDGMEGVLDYVEGTTGVDITSETFFEEAGLDPDFRPALFRYRSSLAVVLGVADPSSSIKFLDSVEADSGAPVLPLAFEQGKMWSFGSSVAAALTGNLMVVVVGYDEPAMQVLATLLCEPEPTGAWEVEEGKIVFSVAGSAGHRFDFPDSWLQAMGPLSGLAHAVSGYVSSCESFAGTVDMGDRYRIEATAHGCVAGGGGVPALRPEEGAPEDTIFLAHWALEGESLWGALTETMRALVNLGWAQLEPSQRVFESAAIPLSSLAPDVSVGFLGFSQTLPFDRLLRPKNALDPLFVVHLWLGLKFRDPTAWEIWRGEEVLGKLTAGLKSTDCSRDQVDCTQFCLAQYPENCFSVVQWDGRIYLVTGLGEGARMVNVLSRKVRSLSEALFVHQDTDALTLTLKTKRLVQDLMNKGFPPYFLQILSSILEVRMTFGGVEGNTRITCEIVLR